MIAISFLVFFGLRPKLSFLRQVAPEVSSFLAESEQLTYLFSSVAIRCALCCCQVEVFCYVFYQVNHAYLSSELKIDYYFVPKFLFFIRYKL